MLELLSHNHKSVSVQVCAKTVEVPESISAAEAFMMHSMNPYCRATPVSGEKRAPLCMMGVCFECLLEVDGDGNVQGCMVQVKEGMKIERQSGVQKL